MELLVLTLCETHRRLIRRPRPFQRRRPGLRFLCPTAQQSVDQTAAVTVGRVHFELFGMLPLTVHAVWTS